MISKQLCILTLFTHLAVIASGETGQTIGREAEPGADPATISGSLYLDPWQIEKEFLDRERSMADASESPDVLETPAGDVESLDVVESPARTDVDSDSEAERQLQAMIE